jgi:hypothetical protein
MGTLARPDGTEREQEVRGSGAEAEAVTDVSAVLFAMNCHDQEKRRERVVEAACLQQYSTLRPVAARSYGAIMA